MNSKNEIFEYLIDQLRQQVNKKDVTSFNVSVQISDLDEVKQVIHNLQQHIAGKNDEIRMLKDSLRQQVNNNQCEDQAHEVQSLKNQLRDASSLVAELQEDNIKKSEHISHLSELVDELMGTITLMNGDVEAYKVLRKCACAYGQSGCRDDAAHIEKSWIEHAGAACPVPDDTVVDIKFRNGKMESNTKALWWSWGLNGGPYEIVAYRVAAQQCNKDDTRECEHDWEYYYPNGRRCTKCGAINL